MAQVACISSENTRDGLQYLGDVVGVFSDDHVFTQHEQEAFDILYVNGSVADVKARLFQLKANTHYAYKWQSDSEYHFTEAEDPDDTTETIQVYAISNKWYKLVNDFKFVANFADLTAEEKQLLATVDINHPSVDSFISKIVKDYATQPGNDVEIIELKNQEPPE